MSAQVGSAAEDVPQDVPVTPVEALVEPPVLAADLTALFSEQWIPMLRLAALLVDDRAAAEDVVQDAFLAVQRNPRAPVTGEAAIAYLRTTVINRSRSVLRHRYVVARFRHRAAPTPQPADPTLSIDEDDATLRALRTLPERQREVLVLRYWSDMSHAEIAQALGLAVGSVKSAASRGLTALRKQLSNEPGSHLEDR